MFHVMDKKVHDLYMFEGVWTMLSIPVGDGVLDVPFNRTAASRSGRQEADPYGQM